MVLVSRKGKAIPCCFKPSEGVSCVAHGVDFTFEGTAEALEGVKIVLEKHWVIKVGVLLGPGDGDDKEVSVLKRVVRSTKDALLYETDPRHVEKLLVDMDMSDCKPMPVPGVRYDVIAGVGSKGPANVFVHRGRGRWA